MSHIGYIFLVLSAFFILTIIFRGNGSLRLYPVIRSSNSACSGSMGGRELKEQEPLGSLGHWVTVLSV